MKIKKVKRIKDIQHDGLEVEIEENGDIRIECFTDAEEALELENGEEKFIKIIKRNSDNNKNNKESERRITELTKFRNKEI